MFMTNQWESRWLLVVSSACTSTPVATRMRPMYHFSESPKRVWGHRTGSLHGLGIDRLSHPWPRGIDCLVQSGPQISVFTAIWTSPVRKLVATDLVSV